MTSYSCEYCFGVAWAWHVAAVASRRTSPNRNRPLCAQIIAWVFGHGQLSHPMSFRRRMLLMNVPASPAAPGARRLVDLRSCLPTFCTAAALVAAHYALACCRLTGWLLWLLQCEWLDWCFAVLAVLQSADLSRALQLRCAAACCAACHLSVNRGHPSGPRPGHHLPPAGLLPYLFASTAVELPALALALLSGVPVAQPFNRPFLSTSIRHAACPATWCCCPWQPILWQWQWQWHSLESSLYTENACPSSMC